MNLLVQGTINTKGLVSDVELTFDASHGSIQTLTLNSNPNQNITINFDASESVECLGAGYSGTGTMSISDASIVESNKGYIGYKSGSTGLVSVNGSGSSWANSSELYIGKEGNGTLEITGGW